MTASIVKLPKPVSAPVNLTMRRIDSLKPRKSRYSVADAQVAGLDVRVYPSGAKVFYVRGRLGKGRAARRLDLRLADCSQMSLTDARGTAAAWLVQMRAGEHPAGTVEAQQTLDALIGLYDRRLKARRVVRRSDTVSVVRRGLRPYLRRPAVDLTRVQVVRQIDAWENEGRPGAAEYLRKCSMAFLNWAANVGHLPANPLGGYRRERNTRSQSLSGADPITFTTDAELKVFWAAAAATPDVIFRDYLRFLLLTGTRRGETASMQWADFDEACGVWAIRAERTKTGVGRSIPLGPAARALLAGMPRMAGSGLVFPGRGGATMSGWTKRLAPVREALDLPDFAFHALRRTFRTGLAELGVRDAVAELMLGHVRSDLEGRYNKSDLMALRAEAQQKWEAHVAASV